MTQDQSTETKVALIATQRDHWEKTLGDNPVMYGSEPSGPGRYAAQRFANEGLTHVLELGAGQGRDTLALLQAGLEVHALDYAQGALTQIRKSADPRYAQQLATKAHDVRQPLPYGDGVFDACYSHMLFTMALSTLELEHLAQEVHRVLRPNALCIYTVRHTGDSHYGTGTPLGDNLYENGGFVVHFFDQSLVERLSNGFEIEDLTAFEEGTLPRKLWRVTLRKTDH